MPLSRRSILISATASAGAVGLAACGSGEPPAAKPGKPVMANGTEPQNPLVPTNTDEVGGGNVLGACFSRLTHFTAKGEPEMDLAESVESDDHRKWTVKLRPGIKFSDGSPITAKHFVDAWNYGALTTNAQQRQSSFEPIKGFAEVAAAKPTATTMSGLKVIDDRTFTIELTSPQSDFLKRIGHYSYSPMPESAYKDMKAFGAKPVGSGPYQVKKWTHSQSVELVPNEHYTGPRKAKNSGVTFTIYQDPDTAYNDLISGALDLLDQIPEDRVTKFEMDLGDRAVNQPGAVFQSITIPLTDKSFSGEAGRLRRQAISMAIERPEVCRAIFNDTRTPAVDFVPAAIPGGGQKDIPGGEVLQSNPAKAKELWKKAEAISPFAGTFTLSYNSDGPHRVWVEAVCNTISNNLGITAEPKPYPTFGGFRKAVQSGEMTGAFRTGWQADYPSPSNFLSPQYSSAAADGKGSNDSGYKNPEFDALLAKALSAPDEKASIEGYKAAEALLMRDLPAIPLWYQNTATGSSENVRDVVYGWDGVPLYFRVEK